MSDLERLARAVLLFHRGGPWTGHDRCEWVMLTGEEDATTRTLCDLARRVALTEGFDDTMADVLTADDHARGCAGREYECTCGYDSRVSDEITRLRLEVASLRRILGLLLDAVLAFENEQPR